MPLTVLSDANVKSVLNNLQRGDVENLLESLRQSLHEYSTGTSKDGACAENQPERTVLDSRTGNTTLFMPSASSHGIGMKVVTLASPRDETALREDSEHSHTPVPPTTATTPQGALTIMDTTGLPIGFINAEEVTAFRTALASSLLLIRRVKVKTLTVFGVGKQAYWHVRLALLLHGSTIKTVNFVNREFSDRARGILKGFVQYDLRIKEQEGWSGTHFGMLTPGYGEYNRLIKEQVRAADVIFCTTPSTYPLFDEKILTNTEGRKKGRLIVAVGSYKKHMIELPPEILEQAVKRHGHGHHFHKHAEEGGVIVVDTLACVTQTGELAQANIRENQTVELGELVLLERAHQDSSLDDDESPSEVSSSPQESLEALSLGAEGRSSMSQVFGGDSSSHVNNENKSPSRKSSFSSNHRASFSFPKRSGSASSSLRGRKKREGQTEKEDAMCRWLSRGTVIYKSVGMGLMDLVVGGELVLLAREMGIGVTVDEF